MKKIFITYATKKFTHVGKEFCKRARQVGFDESILYTPESLCRKFKSENKSLLSNPRGAGLWIWKPQIIKQTIEKEYGKNSIIFYSDCGHNEYYFFSRFPSSIFKEFYKLKSDYVVGIDVDFNGTIIQFTKKECLDYFNLTKSEIDKINLIHPQPSIYRPTKKSLLFINKWLKHCEKDRLISPNWSKNNQDPAFIDHRYDMSILSILAFKNNEPVFKIKLLNKILSLRPGSLVSQLILKSSKNIDDIFRVGFIYVLIREFFRSKRYQNRLD